MPCWRCRGSRTPTERRRRAVKRGRDALDALDDLKLGAAVGSLDTGALARLKSACHRSQGRLRRPGLDTVLAEISLRVEVEVAKFGAPQPDVDRREMSGFTSRIGTVRQSADDRLMIDFDIVCDATTSI